MTRCCECGEFIDPADDRRIDNCGNHYCTECFEILPDDCREEGDHEC